MSPSPVSMLVFSLLVSYFSIIAYGGNLNDDIEIQWGDGRGKISPDGKLLSLSLDKFSGSGFFSKHKYLFGRFDMEIKLIPGNSAGTVTTFYLSSQGSAMEPNHDEIDFEFLGNSSENPYTLHTNVFTNGKGDKEMQFNLWFDPTEDFHTYSILWNPQHVIFYIDDIPIRDFENLESMGVLFPKSQPMKLYSTLWNGEAWATQGGRVKTDWSQAPFTAYYRNFSANACVWSPATTGTSNCSSDSSRATLASQNAWFNQELDYKSYTIMRALQKKYRTYNYCTDMMRFLSGIPRECTVRQNYS